MGILAEIAIYGAGGFGREVACIINKINEIKPTWKLIGFFDDGEMPGTAISHFGNVLGNFESMNTWNGELSVVFAIGSPQVIQKIVSKTTNTFIEFPNLIHPDVYFADPQTLKIGKGNVIVRGCSFSCDVQIGDFNQFNSISALAHDVQVGSYNVFMPLVRISGGTQIGDENFFGINAVVLQNLKIGKHTRIAAGSMVIRKTKDNFLYMGNPAKRVDI